MLPTPGLPSFDYVRPASPAEVTKLLLKSNGDARLFMGGTDVFVRMRDGFFAPKFLIDVKRLPGMDAIKFSKRAGLTIGAGVDMNTIARHLAVAENYPILVEAIDSVASYQLRTRATMGGNLCNASPAADTAPAAMVLGANLVLHGRRGERVVPIAKFFVAPGKTAMKPGEFLLRIEIPPPPAQRGAVGRYLKLGRNAHGDLAIVGVAVLGYPDKRAKSGYAFRIALASVAPTPIRSPKAEAVLSSSPITPETIEAAADAAMETAKPIDDVRSSAEYRKAMVRALAKRAVNEVWRAISGA
ncbi:MAG: xanthine dehydrogenase family protein subunit M [Chloroflexi bacterium]|nr:xanthine dehydrogenase family protein subunit M [Chloroflexota bacterium]